MFTGEPKRFSSAILPPWFRKSPKISEVLPLLCPHGLSSGGFVPALEQFLGSSAGLSPATDYVYVCTSAWPKRARRRTPVRTRCRIPSITCRWSRHRPQRPLLTVRNGRSRPHSASVRSPRPTPTTTPQEEMVT
ncbi:hypothetical protein GCM10010240_56110 [Streptomyces griseoviridis]|nr:hypothetical protein GCM10010240_56110 [Streptomyces griseoviridis]